MPAFISSRRRCLCPVFSCFSVFLLCQSRNSVLSPSLNPTSHCPRLGSLQRVDCRTHGPDQAFLWLLLTLVRCYCQRFAFVSPLTPPPQCANTILPTSRAVIPVQGTPQPLPCFRTLWFFPPHHPKRILPFFLQGEDV